MRTEDVAFISGFLRAFALANAGLNYGPDYSLTVVPVAGTPLESVTAYHETTRLHYEKIYPQFDLWPKLSPLEHWREELPSLLAKWLFEGECPPRFDGDQINKGGWIVEQLEQRLLQSLEGEASVCRLTIFLSENAADDWLIEDSAGLYHLHLGWSD